MFYEAHPASRNVFVLERAAKDAPPQPVATTPATESIAQFSPDGRWIAYQTNASGRFEIVVKPFRDGSVEGGTWQVSKDGGVQPRWRKDGRELYFIAPDGAHYGRDQSQVLRRSIQAAPARFAPRARIGELIGRLPVERPT